jgi:hypothetical protein
MLPTVHVENRRLFEAAAGRLKLEESEIDHLHACQVCQGVFNILIKLVSAVPVNPGKPGDAA